MQRKVGLACFCWGLLAIVCHAQYVPDVLGNNYLSRTLQMPDDYEGEVVCTLIKKPALPGVKQAVLYIHGYNDYFYQQTLGDSIISHAYNFYAIDLRKYGRSIRPNQEPFFCKQISEYYADIDTALVVIRAEGNERIILMGHSSGGLVASLYLDSKTGKPPVDALILNSPFFDMNMGWVMEKVLIPAVSFIGKLFPRLTVSGRGIGSYAKSLLKIYHGEWEFNTNWKFPNAPVKKGGWLHAIHQGHRRIQKGLKLDCPVLVLSSDKSMHETNKWNDAYLQADIVLDVEDIQRYGAGLGDSVTIQTIPNGIHDLILSPKPARDHAYQAIFSWLESH